MYLSCSVIRIPEDFITDFASVVFGSRYVMYYLIHSKATLSIEVDDQIRARGSTLYCVCMNN